MAEEEPSLQTGLIVASSERLLEERYLPKVLGSRCRKYDGSSIGSMLAGVGCEVTLNTGPGGLGARSTRELMGCSLPLFGGSSMGASMLFGEGLDVTLNTAPAAGLGGRSARERIPGSNRLFGMRAVRTYPLRS